MQHERKPIIDKKEFGTTPNTNYNSSVANKIYIRKDLSIDSSGISSSSFNACDLGLPFLSKRISKYFKHFKYQLLSTLLLGNAGNTEHLRMSPSQGSLDDEASMDSTNTGAGELSDALTVARDKQLISKALDTMARVQCLNGTDISTLTSDEKVIEFDGPVLQDQHITFNLQIPGPVPPYLNIHYICESGSRLLFLSIHWARSIPAFQYLR